MRTLLSAVLVFITVSSLTSAQTPANDFRGFAWGNLLSQVKTSEKSRFVSQDKNDLLSYEDQLAGSEVTVIYEFNDNNKLVSGSYIFTKKYSNPQLYIQDYAKFKNLLTSKYGAPRLSKEEWSANTTPNEKENYGQAISDGNLTLYSVWTTERSEIKISLTQKNSAPYLQIHYTSKSLEELENKEELQKALLKL